MHDINFSHEHELKEHDFLGCCKDCQNSLAVIKPHIMGFADRIRQYSRKRLEALPPEELYRLYQILDDLAHMNAGSHLSSLLLDEEEIRHELPLIRSYYTAFFGIHEDHLADELIHSRDPWKLLGTFPLYPRYVSLVEKQIEAMHIAPGKRLVFIGSGPVPLTLILMNRLFGIRSIGIDNTPETVRLSREVIQHLGLQKEIEIVQGDDSSLENFNWDIVLVAALAEPKVRIFRNLRNILDKRGPAPVVFRTYTGMQAVLYKPVQPEDIKGFKIVKAVAPTGRVNNTTVFVRIDQKNR
ncbi:nicotianamine synthase family protein [Desulfospira joergensenii]|uniref:nicotianamine synthase family protein n=1 Tax=Desulfospira joergensenii TaxID=53329 RepID=UPI0003F8A6EA|nr:nicotianamine synthase family protein [Desulfospira joergensenii]